MKKIKKEEKYQKILINMKKIKKEEETLYKKE